ncbi:TetR/AcrR family transcriptional regulator [Curtobacterium sp. Leaf261]|uniref:TetR/AcrR family transcriptional regulator n=1 Tax=Curtobacterium sp. Leaf261 TaxID=1736311 RepID=UPI00070043BC|nr:TetR family transcriptional regulator [Curtobacterium sp. Leaf261]KQO63831.1 hypothetical protein ASF23_06440 [Curtobacterium sp. Leaf261]
MTDLQSSPVPTIGDRAHRGPASAVDAPVIAVGAPVIAVDAPVIDRGAVIAAAITTFREMPFHRVTIVDVAARAEVPVAEVRAHFPNWDGLVLATLDRWNLARMIPITPLLASHGTVRFLRGIAEATALDPALTRFLMAMSNIAATPDEPIAPMLTSRWTDFYRLVEANLAHDVALGREPSTMVPASGAEQLVAIYEGLQLQYMVRPGLDLVASFDRAVSRLREGWRQSYIPPLWDIGPTA